MSLAEINYSLLREVEQFLYLEARLADENRYRDWEALWADDGIYWVPANSGDIDPELEMSIIYDNRSRISVRVNQFLSGKRFAAQPEIQVRRVVSNVELLQDAGEEVRVGSNAIYFVSGETDDEMWGSRNEFTLRRVDGEFRIVRKNVVLVNAAKALPNLAFLI
ncbi:MAG: aromatic-ring-hydroxylating dioxygenase subunit beta [Gammaproteobacteria bacterium]|uniref:aromatic-ring-hydroxylating dioxygenase subunit beta n=1 Tax=Pseudomaricurvus alcaniphilus TaxID=1166482 RepID=UPI00140B2199|nr:aromatic-ring-hydroxylating dioxygenase subunit beta [Gammaproteobacteria bacterium]NHN39022.1 aromatic-ring-hydroxylating dioxygenase subunit beta [Pseudomaricurvus alcaniphilus]